MKNFFQKITPIIVAFLVIGGAFFVGFKLGEEKGALEVEKVTVLENKETGKPAKVDFAPFWKVWNLLDEKYVSTATGTAATTTIITDIIQNRVWGAIAGMTDSLGDSYTVFFPPENSKLFESEISGSFEGIGMEIVIKDSMLTVVAPLKGTPADKAGIMPGDKILKIDDKITTGLRADQAVKLIRGPRGTTVRLLFERIGKKDSFEIKVVRDTILVPTIDTEYKASAAVNQQGNVSLQGNGIFIIRLYSFSELSPMLFRDSLRQFLMSGSNKLVLDLRGNPGGYLEAAVDMASFFLPAGKVIVTEDYGAKEGNRIHRSRGYNIFDKNLKMVILVNNGSASAAEILAGALQEYGVAKLVGIQTFGKGSVQELVKVTPETSLKVTVAKWLTPKGKSISSGGLKPDYVVEMTLEDKSKEKDAQMDKALELLAD